MTIAVSMPGKMGDALYALPTARLLYGIFGEKIDFYTSDYCRPMEKLVMYQDYINNFIIPEDYKIERMDMGVQPWKMPILEQIYTHVFQLGFQAVPDRSIHQYIAHKIGIDTPLAIRYEYPKSSITGLPKEYICIAPRGNTTFVDTFNTLADSRESVIIGGTGDYTGHGIDMTGLDMLDTLYILSKAKGFVGLMSAMLVLANGFDIPRIAIHDGIHWDMRHVVYTEYNHYPINPTLAGLEAILDK